MAVFVKGQLVKRLAQYFKDMHTNRLSISLLKGEGTMSDLGTSWNYISGLFYIKHHNHETSF